MRHGVSVFLLDEPVQGIDVGAKQVIFDLVRTAAQGGAAVVMCSAVDEDLAALCNRVIVFSQGAITAEFQAPDVSATRIAAASHAIKTDYRDWTS
jgi:ribose transport system ATP-binding protein